MEDRDQEDKWRDRAHRAQVDRQRDAETTPAHHEGPEPCALCVAAGLAQPNPAVAGKYCRVHLDRETDGMSTEELGAAGAYYDREVGGDHRVRFPRQISGDEYNREQAIEDQEARDAQYDAERDIQDRNEDDEDRS
jgi:hypothetical protein